MKKVITYGTFDLFHHGHINLLKRAKALGDYLIVGVTSDDFDRARGKINVHQTLIERIEAVQTSNLADEIIVEEYEGQKIDDIQRLGVDIFAIGNDWEGVFDYLGQYCQVVYLPRTKGISSTQLRTAQNNIRMGFVGSFSAIRRYADEALFVNGLNVCSVLCTKDISENNAYFSGKTIISNTFEELLEVSDAIYLASHPAMHFSHIRQALESKKHVLCESPIALTTKEAEELLELAKKQGVILMDSIKTAYSTAYNRLVLLAKGGKIGDIVSVDAICTSMAELQKNEKNRLDNIWNSLCAWGPTAMLPIFQILGTNYVKKNIIVDYIDKNIQFDRFTKISFIYPKAIASIMVGKGIKSEGELIISGTKGYIYVPAPWWKTDYFEIRYEDPRQNKRYFYQLEGDGIRYMLACFVNIIAYNKNTYSISTTETKSIIQIIENYYKNIDVLELL